jgi:hypothetical protein
VKKLVSVAALGLLILLTAGSAAAQTSVLMRAHIPFQFLAGDSVLPAGTYMVRYDPAFRRVELVSRGGLTWARFERQVARRDVATANGLLVFNKYGTAYALREIWRPGQDRGFQLYRSNAEREMAKGYATAEVATIRPVTR